MLHRLSMADLYHQVQEVNTIKKNFQHLLTGTKAKTETKRERERSENSLFNKQVHDIQYESY